MPQRKFKKGSREAKEFMAYLRSLRGKKRNVGGRDIPKDETDRRRIINALKARYGIGPSGKCPPRIAALFPYKVEKARRYEDIRQENLPKYLKERYPLELGWRRMVRTTQNIEEAKKAAKAAMARKARRKAND